MKIKRTVTDKVIEANQKRAKKSTGPSSETGKMNSRSNAVKSGVTAQRVLPTQDESYRRRIEEQWRKCYKPKGIWENSLTRALSFLDARDAVLEKLEQQEIASLEADAGDLFNVFNSDLNLPIDQLDLPVQQRGWTCDRLRIRATSTEDSGRGSGSREPLSNQGSPRPGFQGSNSQSGNGRSLEVEAELGLSLNRILRYRAAIRKDRYRAIEALHAAQAERRERELQERERERKESEPERMEGENGKKSGDS